MINKDFYPTPSEIVWKMIDWLELQWKYILEPSAGKWDILDVIAWHSSYYNTKKNLYAIESEPELQAILISKGYKVCGNDFLEYKNDINYDFIIMNPPFSNGDEHFLHAWDIIENGTIVCLLNEETVLNPYSEKRKLVQKIINDNNATIDYLWSCFLSSERKTDVRIAMIRITKNTDKNEFEFWEFQKEKIEFSDDILQSEVATLDMIQNIIDDYGRSKVFFAKWVQFLEKACSIAEGISKNYELKPYKIASEWMNVNDKVNKFTKEIKKGVWMKLAQELKIEKYMSNKVKQDFSEKLEKQWAIAINKENIKLFAQAIFQNRESIVEDSILEVFDEFTKYHKENREYIEGWKTNDSWKVNRRVILPRWIEHDWYSWFRCNYSMWGKFTDVEKVMCYLTGKRIETINTLENGLKNTRAWEKFDTEFFECRAYLISFLKIKNYGKTLMLK